MSRPGFRFSGGPLEGGSLDDLPGPLVGMVFAFIDPPTGGVRSALSGVGFDPDLGADVNRLTFEALTLNLARAARLYGLDLREILVAAEAQAQPAEAYVNPRVARGGRSM